MVQVNSNFNLPVFDINFSKEKKMIQNIGMIKESAFWQPDEPLYEDYSPEFQHANTLEELWE